MKSMLKDLGKALLKTFKVDKKLHWFIKDIGNIENEINSTIYQMK